MLDYLLITFLGLSAGVMFGVQIRPPFRWAGLIAGLMTLGVVGVWSLLGREAPGIGPLFAIITPITAVLIAAEARRDERLFLAQSYWRRVLLVLSLDRREIMLRPRILRRNRRYVRNIPDDLRAHRRILLLG